MTGWRRVASATELAEALEAGSEAIEIAGEVSGMRTLTLRPGQRLRGGTLRFGAKGVRLTRDNTLEDVTIRTAEQEVAIFNDTSVPDLGTLTLRGVRTTGQVLLLARDAVQAGHVRVEGLSVDAADVRGRIHRPGSFGLEAMHGAFTLWNQQPDPAITITAELLDIAAGRPRAPVRGSGVMVAGLGDWYGKPDGGTVSVSVLRTGEIHTDGGIRAGTLELLSAGVLAAPGMVADEVVNAGPVTAHGPSDLALLNVGRVRRWVAAAPLTAHGSWGFGFANAGDLDTLAVRAPITTAGDGAVGANLGFGSLRHAVFDSITTAGDGAAGIRVGVPAGVIEIAGDLTTSGGEGQTRVGGGVATPLKAAALTVSSGASIARFAAAGRIAVFGDDVVAVQVDGEIGEIEVAGGITASGARSDAVHVRGDVPGLAAVSITAADGERIARSGTAPG
jgi:hypothetical protein